MRAGHFAALGRVVAQVQHRERIAQAGEAHADAALGRGFRALLRQRPMREVEHVVQGAHLHRHDLGEAFEVELRGAAETEGVPHEARQDHRAEITAAVSGKRLFPARIGGADFLAVAQVVLAVDGVGEQDAGLGKVVRRAHHRVPQLAGGQDLVDPQAVAAQVGPLRNQGRARLGAMHQRPVAAGLQRAHEFVADRYRDVEVVPAPGRALGRDEFQYVGVVDAQDAHLGAAPRACALDRGAGMVEHVHVAARSRGERGRGLDLGTAGTDAREVVAHTAAAPHGLGRLAQGLVDAGIAVFVLALDAVAHGLHETVDQRCLQSGARGAHDAACTNGALLEVAGKALLPFGTQRLGFDACQCACDTGEQVLLGHLTGLEVLLPQHVGADGLAGEGGQCPRIGFALHRSGC